MSAFVKKSPDHGHPVPLLVIRCRLVRRSAVVARFEVSSVASSERSLEGRALGDPLRLRSGQALPRLKCAAVRDNAGAKIQTEPMPEIQPLPARQNICQGLDNGGILRAMDGPLIGPLANGNATQIRLRGCSKEQGLRRSREANRTSDSKKTEAR